MKLTILACLALASQGLCLATPLAGRNFVIPSWEVEVTPGGEKAVLDGTVQEVHAQLLQLNPRWNEDFDFQPSAPPTSANLNKRTLFDGSMRHDCFGDDRQAVIGRIEQGMAYLRGIKARPSTNTGPRWCSRVSCSYKSGITWCNDDPNGKTLESFGSIADGAESLIRRCSHQYTVAGQVFHPTNWNVIVDRQDC
ncbi:hypothetical protein VE03_03483 [Pseudogymnoascus sp. 23342-1-I1]|nr:hypothetical protein VE03_03483 [Pseudogymnoascus sp. 23342-1-I1]